MLQLFKCMVTLWASCVQSRGMRADAFRANGVVVGVLKRFLALQGLDSRPLGALSLFGFYWSTLA